MLDNPLESVYFDLILLFKVRKVTIGDAFTNYLVTNNINGTKVTIGDAFTNYLVTNNINGTTVRVKLLDTSTLTIPFLII